jgi:hypothetical protein
VGLKQAMFRSRKLFRIARSFVLEQIEAVVRLYLRFQI